MFNNIVSLPDFLNANPPIKARVASQSATPYQSRRPEYFGDRPWAAASGSAGARGGSDRLRLEVTAGRVDISLGAVARALALPIATRPGWIRWLSLDQLQLIPHRYGRRAETHVGRSAEHSRLVRQEAAGQGDSSRLFSCRIRERRIRRVSFEASSPCVWSLVEEFNCGRGEFAVVLEDRAVAGVGIDDELRAGDPSVHVFGECGGDHAVVVAVGDECRLGDQSTGRRVWSAPNV